MSSCIKEKLSTPNPDFEYFVIRNTDTIFSPDSVEVGEVVNFRNVGSGDYFSVFPGEPKNSFSSQTDSLAIGVEKNRVSSKGSGLSLRRTGLYYSADYMYSTQGYYEIVYRSTSTANYASDSETKEKGGVFITVTDGRTNILDKSIKVQDSDKEEVLVKQSGDTVYMLVNYGWDLYKVDVKFQVGNAVATRNGAPVGKEGQAFRDRNVDVKQPVVYRITAADGVTTHDYVFVVKFFDKIISDNNNLSGITIKGVKFIPNESGPFQLFYPSSMKSEAVKFGCDSYATIKIGSKSFKVTSTVTVNDLIDASGEIEIVSESGVPKKYTCTLTEESVKSSPLSFSNASGFPVVKGTGDTLKVYLSSDIDITKLVPVYPASNFTVIEYGTTPKVFKNGVDVIDFTSPVPFTHTNGTQVVKQVLVIEKL